MLELYRKQNRAALIPFVMAGDPSLEVSERLILALIEEGAGAIEIGLPFSDALADGPVIQRAGVRALRQNVDLAAVFAMAARISSRHSRVPLILFTYFNPIFQFGLARYTRQARACGIAATLTVDLPPEEAGDYLKFHANQGLKTIFLASPTTSQERLRRVVDSSTGFIYVVSRTGVTGTHASYARSLGGDVHRVRSLTDCPIAVGFGISTAEQAARVARLADGVVVGSAFVKRVEEFSDPERLEAEIRLLAHELTAGIRAN